MTTGMRRFYLIYSAVILLVCIAWLATNKDYSIDHSPKVEQRITYLNLVRGRQYQTLISELKALQIESEQGKTQDTELYDAFSSVSIDDPEIELILQEMVETHPDSFIPYALLGKYYKKRGWLLRGGDYINKTSPEQLNGMSKTFEVAIIYYAKALEYNDKVMFIYADIMDMANAMGNREMFLDISNKGLKINPTSTILFRHLLTAYEPKWGGSFDQLEAIIQKMRTHYSDNPALKEFDNYIAYVAAESLVRKWDKSACQKALEVIDKVEPITETPLLFAVKADAYRCLNNYEDAIHNYRRYLESHPLNYRRRTELAETYRLTNELNSAFRQVNIVISMNPYDKSALEERGHIYLYSDHHDLAEKDLTQALQYNPNNAYVHRLLGWMYRTDGSRHDLAKSIRHYKASVEQDDRSTLGWYGLMLAQWSSKDCEYLSSLQKYYSLCELGELCTSQAYVWARNTLSAQTTDSTCSLASAPPSSDY